MARKKTQEVYIDSPNIPPIADSPVVVRTDGWENLVKGVGSKRDSRVSSTFTGESILPKQTLTDLYTSDGIVRKIVDAVPDDMFRPWGTVENDPTDKYSEGLISHEMRRLEASRHFTEAKKWARLTGGALLYVGITGSGGPEDELDFNKISSIEFFKTFDLSDIQTWDCIFDEDLTSPTFGKIKLYSVKIRVGNSYSEAKIHASRCIPFYGQKLPLSSVVGNTLEIRQWGIPIMQYMYQDIKDFRLAFANTSAILQEFVIGKYKFQDLDEILAAGNEKKLQARISGIEMSKSLINAVMLGTDEEYQRDSASVGGLADLLDRFMMLVSSVSSIPVTRLFGRSASGLNATGEGDLKSYYDLIAAEQSALTPEVERLIKMIAVGNGLSEDEDYSWEWGNLNQLTSEQVANEERIHAETLRTNMDAAQRAIQEGVLTPEQVYDLYYKDKFDEKEYDIDEVNKQMEALMGDDNASNPDGNVAPGKSEISSSKTPSII